MNQGLGWLPVIVVLVLGIAMAWSGTNGNNMWLLGFGVFEIIIGLLGVYAISKRSRQKVEIKHCPDCDEPVTPGDELCPKCGFKL